MSVELLNLEPQKISRDLKGKYIWLYALPKTGKTTLASQMPKTLICSFEPGSNALHNVFVQPMLKWNDWKQVVRQLINYKEELKDKFETICMDTVDEAYKLCEKFICEQNGVDKINDIPYGGGHKLLDDEFSSTLREIAFAGYGLFFITHSKEKKYEDSKGQEKIQVVPALADRPFNIINKMVDIIAYLRQIPVEEDGHTVRKRYLFFREDERFYAGSRFGYIIPYIEYSYENLVKAIYDAIDKEVEAKGGGEVLNTANPYTTLNYENLIEEAKILYSRAVDANLSNKCNEILQKEFGKPIKFSEVPKTEVEALNRVLFKIKELF